MRRAEHLTVATSDGLYLHVARSGHGPPLLLLHGFTGSTETWDALRAELDGRYAVVAVDLPGHGRSPAAGDPARGSLPRLADDLAALLDALSIEHTTVLGYSLGGRAALHLAVRHPERVSGLVLESASPGIADPDERARRAAADAALADDLERDGIEAFVERWERLPLWASQASLRADSRAALRAQRLRNDPSGLASSLRGAGAGAADTLAGRLGELHVPTLLVAGALDAKYVDIARAMHGALPDARLAVVPGAGHAVHLERPAEFAAVVRDFLRALPRVPDAPGKPAKPADGSPAPGKGTR